jgi:hypothetical protein
MSALDSTTNEYQNLTSPFVPLYRVMVSDRILEYFRKLFFSKIWTSWYISIIKQLYGNLKIDEMTLKLQNFFAKNIFPFFHNTCIFQTGDLIYQDYQATSCKPNVCPICDVPLYGNMNRHLRKHSELRPFECTQCHRKSTFKFTCESIQERSHTSVIFVDEDSPRAFIFGDTN